MLHLVAIEAEKIAEIRNALKIILGEIGLVGSMDSSTVEHIMNMIPQVERIDKLLPVVNFEGGK